MGLNVSKLEKIRRRGTNTIARCPACAETGSDRKGEHLFINAEGQFGCVLYPGPDGQAHRQRIFELAGIKEIPVKYFEVRKPLSASPGPVVIQNDILGHLGRFDSTHARKSLNSHAINDNSQEDLKFPVPSDPEPNPEQQRKVTFTPEEERLLVGIDAESLEKVRMIKDIFNGTVVAVDNPPY